MDCVYGIGGLYICIQLMERRKIFSPFHFEYKYLASVSVSKLTESNKRKSLTDKHSPLATTKAVMKV